MSQVRVGVRVRPLTSNEQSKNGQAVVDVSSFERTVGIAKRKFTYDTVFDSSISQEDLYQNLAPPMLESFLDGFNATIMAYGQTGSGKTFTMGSEADNSTDKNDIESLDSNEGLIPRFMSDIFTSLSNLQKCTSENEENENSNHDSQSSSTQKKLVNYNVSASFLEVYGEDIHDLLDQDRKALPLREDANGGVIVVGLKNVSVSSANDALNVLRTGTMNRTTAATLMNHTSSRSHAVFSVNLQQTTLEDGDNDDGMQVTTSSRFTFVDLAGSERMKKTGAEGERAREGIKINVGLLALGNVINALADDERLAKGEKVHVPYRQSKLTRLLQDALGGNSQTLFLACVSPSNTNANETLSTLQYANRARNIKNAPTKNIDATILELQRLRNINKILQCELIKNKFSNQTPRIQQGNDDHINDIGVLDENLFKNTQVLDYMNKIFEKAESENGADVSKYNFNIPTSLPSKMKPNQFHRQHFIPLSSVEDSQSVEERWKSQNDTIISHNKEPNIVNRQSIMEEIDSELLDVNPDEDLAILDQLLDLQHHDQEYRKNQKQEQDEIDVVEGELEKEEHLLLQLKESLKAYQTMKTKYEAMMEELQSLETAKESLASELERVLLDPSKGCSKAIKKKLEKVEANLARARSETRKHQQMCRKAEQEAKRCHVLENKISQLKQGRVTLLRKQKEAAAKHKDFTETKKKEIISLKRKEKKSGQKVSKLEAECKKHKVNLEKRKVYSDKLSAKLKQTETHLMKLLAMRNRDFTDRNKKLKPGNVNSNVKQSDKMEISDTFAKKTEEISSIKFLLEKMVSDRVMNMQIKTRYEQKVEEYSNLMRELMSELKALQKEKESAPIIDQTIIKEREDAVEGIEVQIDLVTADLDDLKSKLPSQDDVELMEETNGTPKNEISAHNMISKIDAPALRTLLWELLNFMTKIECKRSQLEQSLERKDAALLSFENEVDILNRKIEVISKKMEMMQRVSVTSNADKRAVDNIMNQESEIKNLQMQLKSIESKKVETDLETNKLKNDLAEANSALSSSREKLTMLEVATKNKKIDLNSETLLQHVQKIWCIIGIPLHDREKYRKEIETCLEDTCLRLFKDAKDLEGKTQAEIESLKHSLKRINQVLGINNESESLDKILSQDNNLFRAREVLKDELDRVMPRYNAALDRKVKIANEADILMKHMNINSDDISSKLLHIIKSKGRRGMKRDRPTDDKNSRSHKLAKERRAKMKDVEELVKALEPIHQHIHDDTQDTIKIKKTNENFHGITEESNSLSDEFLNECEHDLKKLRLKKSEKLAFNSSTRENCRKLALDMNLRERDLLSVCVHSIKKRTKKLPEWWIPGMAEQICHVVMSKGGILEVNQSFTLHLGLINESLENVALGRRLLAEKLQGEVEHAHKIMLSAIECKNQTNEEYDSFYSALFRLPPLSKDHINACIDEMNVLISTAEAMTQSEVEALAVIWEALNVTSTERGRMWGEVEQEINIIQAKTESPFDSVRQACATDIEEWVLIAVKEATKLYRLLTIRLYKLSKIHNEVLQLGRRQDSKSKILSLDAEIRILSSKLTDFESKAGSKNRLLTKKANSSSLLKEERFRKQMQASYATKLQSLGKLLNDWEEKEGKVFDANLLNDDIQVLLDKSSDYDSWVDERTAFMHLNTMKKRWKVNETSPESFDQTNDKNVVQGHQVRLHKNVGGPRTRRTLSPKGKRNGDTTKKYRARQSTLTASPLRSKVRNRNPTMENSTKAASKTKEKDSFKNKRATSKSNESTNIKRSTSPKPKYNKSRRPLSTQKNNNEVKTPNLHKCNKSPLRMINTEPDRDIVLPFGHILSKTPQSKENRRFND